MWLGIGQPLSMVQLKRINELIDNVASLDISNLCLTLFDLLQKGFFSWSHSNPQNCNDFSKSGIKFRYRCFLHSCQTNGSILSKIFLFVLIYLVSSSSRERETRGTFKF